MLALMPHLLLQALEHGSDVSFSVLLIDLHPLLQLLFGQFDEVVVFLHGFLSHFTLVLSLFSQMFQKFGFLTLKNTQKQH